MSKFTKNRRVYRLRITHWSDLQIILKCNSSREFCSLFADNWRTLKKKPTKFDTNYSFCVNQFTLADTILETFYCKLFKLHWCKACTEQRSNGRPFVSLIISFFFFHNHVEILWITHIVYKVTHSSPIKYVWSTISAKF